MKPGEKVMLAPRSLLHRMGARIPLDSEIDRERQLVADQPGAADRIQLPLGQQRLEPQPGCDSIPAMAEIVVTVKSTGEAYVALVVGQPPEVRDSVALDALEDADTIPALDGLVLDFDHYGRLVGVRVTGSADSILAPSLLDAAGHGGSERG